MLCTRCGKRPAVVFVSNNNSKDAPTAGYCLTCAKELGIKPVEDLISKMGISDEDLENVQDQMNTLMNSMGDGDMSQLMEQLGADNLAEQMGDFSKDGDGSEDDDFSHGAPAFPAFFNSMFGGQNNNATNQDNNKKGKKEKKEKNRKHINLYCEDLTRKARDGKIDRIVGRDSEIERVIQILSRRTKNNPCLIGEPGVGKTAIAEGLALRIAAGNVPQRLKNKEIQLLDLTSLVAGTQFRGQFESRIKGLVSEIKENGNIILFIDEVHSLVGTGDNEQALQPGVPLPRLRARGNQLLSGRLSRQALHVLHDRQIDIIAAKTVVSLLAENAEAVGAVLVVVGEHTRVERATAEVVDQHLLLDPDLDLGVQQIGERSGRGLRNHLCHSETRDLCRTTNGLALRVLVVCGNGDVALGVHTWTVERVCASFHRLEQLGSDLFAAHLSSLPVHDKPRIAVFSSHNLAAEHPLFVNLLVLLECQSENPLYARNNEMARPSEILLRDIADRHDALRVFDEGRKQVVSVGIGKELLLLLEQIHGRVRRAKINSEGVIH